MTEEKLIVRRNQVMRPQIISFELIEEICNYISAGHTYAQSAKLAGISESTFFRWLSFGRDPNAELLYRHLYLEVRDASEFAEEEALQLIRSSAIKDKNWRAAAWTLERRHPEKYVKHTKFTKCENPHNEEIKEKEI